jgi:hypothetical protein
MAWGVAGGRRARLQAPARPDAEDRPRLLPGAGGQCGVDEPGAAQGGAHAHKKTAVGRERDEGARAAWREVVAGLDGAGLIFFDETSAQLTLTPLRAWAPRGERAVDRVSSRRW